MRIHVEHFGYYDALPGATFANVLDALGITREPTHLSFRDDGRRFRKVWFHQQVPGPGTLRLGKADDLPKCSGVAMSAEEVSAAQD